MIRILSIDGGGIRGIIPLKVLEYIECQTGKQIHELFDVIGGTSTGGIIALGLNCKKPGSDEIYQSTELLKFYITQEDVKRIFKHKIFRQLENEEEIDEDSALKETITADESLRRPGYLGPYYVSDSIENYLKEKFGENTKISELETKPDVTVFSYDIQNDCPYYFNSTEARKNPKDDYCVWQAARATSAAPTYFPAAKFASEPDSPIFVDGGVYINNPALTLLIQAKQLYPKEQNFLLVSLGTGDTKLSDADDLANAGAYGWLIKHQGALLEVMMKGASYTIDRQLQELVSEKSNSGFKIPSLKSYERYQKELLENIAMDDIKPQTIDKLKSIGEALVKEKEDSLKKLCKELVGN